MALHMRQRYLAAQRELVQDMTERLHRLEIRHRELLERMELLEGQQERLLARWKGDRGGRPSKAPEPPQNPLDLVERGDKAALRTVLGVVPGRPYPHQ